MVELASPWLPGWNAVRKGLVQGQGARGDGGRRGWRRGIVGSRRKVAQGTRDRPKGPGAKPVKVQSTFEKYRELA